MNAGTAKQRAAKQNRNSIQQGLAGVIGRPFLSAPTESLCGFRRVRRATAKRGGGIPKIAGVTEPQEVQRGGKQEHSHAEHIRNAESESAQS
jgi:hypothetical protein